MAFLEGVYFIDVEHGQVDFSYDPRILRLLRRKISWLEEHNQDFVLLRSEEKEQSTQSFVLWCLV